SELLSVYILYQAEIAVRRIGKNPWHWFQGIKGVFRFDIINDFTNAVYYQSIDILTVIITVNTIPYFSPGPCCINTASCSKPFGQIQPLLAVFQSRFTYLVIR